MLEVLPALKYSAQIPLPASPPTLQAKQTPSALASTDRESEHAQGYSPGPTSANLSPSSPGSCQQGLRFYLNIWAKPTNLFFQGNALP